MLLTKERLEQYIKSPLEHGLTRSEQMEVARQLLASMEQVPVYLRPFGDDGETFVACDGNDERAITPYAAPQLPRPAGLSVTEGVLKGLLPDAEKSEFWFEHGGKIFFEGAKFNNAVFEACRAVMLKGAEDVTS